MGTVLSDFCSPLPQVLPGSNTAPDLEERGRKVSNLAVASRASRLFALIVGINGYTGCRSLFGAVTDAKSMKTYLIESLGVPEGHIHVLLDHQATRDAIIDALKYIPTDQRINRGDPIIIFFSGHGGEVPTPRNWNIERKTVQCLLPCDYKPACVHPIPGRTIGALIDAIAKTHGNNIAVILDCCYSAGATRDENEEYEPRTLYLNDQIPEDLDQDIWGDRYGAIPDSFAARGLRSHVLLAACGENELAYEREGRGQFTTALLEMLQGCIADTNPSFTYAQVLERIRLEKQSPHCIGIHQHRLLFDMKMPAGRQVYYTAEVTDGKCVIDAGLAHGVSRGVEFTLYDHDKRRVGVTEVHDTARVEDFQTTVTSSADLILAPEPIKFAKLTGVRFGEALFYVTPGENLSAVLQGPDVSDLWFSKQAEGAKLQLAMENSRVVFTTLGGELNRFGANEKLPFSVEATRDVVAHILRAAAHFYWYLQLASNLPSAPNDIALDFYRLMKKRNLQLRTLGMKIMIPTGPGLRQRDPSLDCDVISFVVQRDILYGIEIRNNTSRDLYLNVFLFNNSNLSIIPCYIQSSAGQPEPPLKKDGSFTIGYGSTGTSPLTFSLGDGQDVDVAYLKVFFSTLPIDLTDIVQMSPFPDVNAQPLIRDDGRVGTQVQKRPVPSVRHIWFTRMIPVVQRRG